MHAPGVGCGGGKGAVRDVSLGVEGDACVEWCVHVCVCVFQLS